MSTWQALVILVIGFLLFEGLHDLDGFLVAWWPEVWSFLEYTRPVDASGLFFTVVHSLDTRCVRCVGCTTSGVQRG